MQTKKQKTVRKRVYLALIVIFLLSALFIYKKFAVYFKPLYQLTFEKKIELKKAEDQRINMLFLGIGGGRHDGPLLTDTMIFASIDPSANRVTLVSIPRDLWVSEINDKVNKVYAYNETKENGTGLAQTKKIVSKIVGQKVDYGFRIDFNGFTKGVDMLGGIDVDVERTFEDFAYPISGKENDLCGYPDEAIASLSAQIATGSATDYNFFPCRFEHLYFEKGNVEMDGDTALKFVRSRHALGVEGTDFARSKRQEKVIRAVKDKVFSADTFLNPVKLISLLELFKDSIDTDIKEDELDDFIKLARKMKDATIESIILEDGDNTDNATVLLINPPTSPEYNYQWVLVPSVGVDDFSEIHSYISCIIKYKMCLPSLSPTPIRSNR